mgnify:CR=1 FL=1
MRWSTELAVPTRALAIAAHPDDVEFGCGATLAKWASRGCVVHYLVCTDGSKGTWDPGQDPAQLVATRQVEQRNSRRGAQQAFAQIRRHVAAPSLDDAEAKRYGALIEAAPAVRRTAALPGGHRSG